IKAQSYKKDLSLLCLMGATINIIIIACAIAACIWGAWKGFANQIIGVIAILLGIWGAAKIVPLFSDELYKIFDGKIAVPVMKVVTFILLLVIIIILCHIVGNALKGAVKLTLLDWLDRLLGAFLCLFKVLLVLSVFACIVNYTATLLGISTTEHLRQCTGFDMLLNFSDKVFPFLKNAFAEVKDEVTMLTL
ncbi:MAG: CvpA family protein, partial [Bacteroidales bacterium]